MNPFENAIEQGDYPRGQPLSDQLPMVGGMRSQGPTTSSFQGDTELRNAGVPGTRVAIIDAQVAFRDLLRGYLERAGGLFTVVREGNSGQEAVDLCEEKAAELLLLDCGIADLPCVEVVARALRFPPHVRILLVAADDSCGLRDAVKAGAHGCVLKKEPLEDFYAAMKIVSAGGSFFSARLPEIKQERQAQLTRRQSEVLGLIASGHSTKEVADRLQISFKTADHHRSRLMKKLKVHDVTSLVRYAIRHGVAEV